MSTANLKIIEEYCDLIEKELEQALYSADNSDFTEAMKYSTLDGGKRIRGILTLEFCRVFSGSGDFHKALCSAAAIEMIHAFSLIHDDLPCMDDDDFRRGKPSCHKRFNEATAVLAGDGLIAAAFNTAAATAFIPKGLTPKQSVSLISTLSNATMEMLKGQQLDMDFEGGTGKISEDDILGMYNRKTCALISAACVCGAICANASDKNIHAARGYGVALGLAFQLNDDLLDFKTEKKGKKTYATIFGEKKTKTKSQEYTNIAVKLAKKFTGGDLLVDLATSLNTRRS